MLEAQNTASLTREQVSKTNIFPGGTVVQYGRFRLSRAWGASVTREWEIGNRKHVDRHREQFCLFSFSYLPLAAFRWRPVSNLATCSTREKASWLRPKYPRSAEISSCVSSSLRDPFATFKNCANSFRLLRAAPSAILLGIETAALRICATSPNSSCLGNDCVAA